jgi:hypothetical protein
VLAKYWFQITACVKEPRQLSATQQTALQRNVFLEHLSVEVRFIFSVNSFLSVTASCSLLDEHPECLKRILVKIQLIAGLCQEF